MPANVVALVEGSELVLPEQQKAYRFAIHLTDKFIRRVQWIWDFVPSTRQFIYSRLFTYGLSITHSEPSRSPLGSIRRICGISECGHR